MATLADPTLADKLAQTGAEVLTDESTLDFYAHDIYSRGADLAAVVRPHDKHQLAAAGKLRKRGQRQLGLVPAVQLEDGGVDVEGADGSDDRLRAAHRPGGPVERRVETVTCSVHLLAPIPT